MMRFGWFFALTAIKRQDAGRRLIQFRHLAEEIESEPAMTNRKDQPRMVTTERLRFFGRRQGWE